MALVCDGRMEELEDFGKGDEKLQSIHARRKMSQGQNFGMLSSRNDLLGTWRVSISGLHFYR